MPDLDT